MEPTRHPIAPASATSMMASTGLTPAKMVPLTTITPASGMTISLGRGIQQLSIAMASTIPAKPVVAYRLVINVVIASVRWVKNKIASLDHLCF